MKTRMNVLNFGGEFGYTVEEKFSLITGVSFNQYTGLRNNRRAWGLLPLELNTALRDPDHQGSVVEKQICSPGAVRHT